MRYTTKMLFGVFCVLLLLLVSLSIFNYVRLEPAEFNKSASGMIERSRRIQENARRGYQDEVLASLAQNPYNGPYFRLDDRLMESVVLSQPHRFH